MPDWNHIDMPVYCKHAKAYIACIQGCSCSIIWKRQLIHVNNSYQNTQEIIELHAVSDSMHI